MALRADRTGDRQATGDDRRCGRASRDSKAGHVASVGHGKSLADGTDARTGLLSPDGSGGASTSGVPHREMRHARELGRRQPHGPAAEARLADGLEPGRLPGCNVAVDQ